MEKIEKQCPRCESYNVAKVVSAKAACIPEIQEELRQGKAVLNCCCCGTGSVDPFRCLDCGFEWDYYIELGMKQNKEYNLKNQEKSRKKSFLSFLRKNNK